MRRSSRHHPGFALVTFTVTVDDEEQLHSHMRWSERVRLRAGWRCEECGATDVPLEAHHINQHGKGWAERNGCEPDNRLANGRCLCGPCHASLTHSGRVRGRPTQQHRDNISTAKMGHEVSEETRAAVGASSRERWRDPDRRAEQIEAVRAQWRDPDYRARQSAAHEKKVVS